MARQRGGRGGGGGGGGGQSRRGGRRGGRGSRQGVPPKGGRSPQGSYYMQPGKRGSVVILHRAVGNRASPKVCGVMPTRNHANALIDQLKRAESALHDLFYEATDDGIEALEAVLAACRDAVLSKTPPPDDAITLEEMAAEIARIQGELDTRATQDRAVS